MADDISGLLSNPAFVEALGGPDTVKQLSAYLGLIGPQQSDLDKIDKDKWLNLGFGLLQGRKGDEFGAIGRAGMNALQTANQERTQLQAQRGQTLTQAMGLLQMAKANQSLKLKQQQMDENAAAFGGQPPQGQPPAPPQPQGPPAMGALGGASPVPPPGMTTTPPAQLPSPPQAGAPPNDANAYRQLAKIAAKYGDAESAKKYSDVANSLDAEFNPEPRTVLVDGKPTLVLVDKRGNVKPMTGMTPAEKLHFANLGGSYQGFNDYTGAPVGPGAQTTQSPDSKAREAVQWARLNAEDSAPMSQDAIAAAAARYQIDGTLPALGMGKAARADRKNILDMAAASGVANGITPEDQRMAQISGHANTQSLSKLTQQSTMVGAFERTFNKNADLVLDMSSKVDRTGVPLVNRWLQAGQRAVTGDPALSAFDVGVKSVVNEYSKIVSGSMGNTALAEGEVKKVEAMLAAAQTDDQVKSVINFMRKETANRMQGFKEQADELRAGMKGGGKSAAPAAPAAGAGKTVVRTGTDPKTGQRVAQFSDGSIGPAP